MASILISYQCAHDGWCGGAEREFVRKLKVGPNLVYNNYNTTSLGAGHPLASLL